MKNGITLLGALFTVALLTASSCCNSCCKKECDTKAAVVEEVVAEAHDNNVAEQEEVADVDAANNEAEMEK